MNSSILILVLIATLSCSISFDISKCPFPDEGKTQRAARFRNGKGILYFEHIHKAGGSTLCSLLKRSPSLQIKDDLNCNILGNRLIPRNWSMTDVENFLHEHGSNLITNEDSPFSPNMRQALHHPSWSFVTIVRNPVSRILSHFRFEELYKSYKNVLEWVDKAPFHTQNLMVRKFASMYPDLPEDVANDWSWMWPHWLDKVNASHLKYNTPQTLSVVTREDLEKAKATLDQFSVVLILEWLSETAPLLGHYFDVPTDDLRSRNWTGSVEETKPFVFHRFDRTTRKSLVYSKIAAMNKYDFELYRYAKKLARCNMENTYFQDDDYAHKSRMHKSGVATSFH